MIKTKIEDLNKTKNKKQSMQMKKKIDLRWEKEEA
jgi:hypothetical protein